MKRWVILSLLVVLVDQLSKMYADQTLTLYAKKTIVEGFFYLSLVYNRGAAFSFLSNAGGWQHEFFIILAVAVSIYLLYWLHTLQPSQRWLAVCIALILGGAVGNVIDRLLYHHVIDFLDFNLGFMRWPTFNLADTAISCGVAGLALALIKGWDRLESETKPSDSDEC